MRISKLATGMLFLAFLGAFFGTVLAEPFYIQGDVWFAYPDGDSVPCVDTYLYSDPSCQPMYELSRTQTDVHGQSSFYGEFPETTWVKIDFDADKSCPFCSANGYYGTCSDTSIVAIYITDETETMHFDLDQSACSCPDP